MPNWGEVLRDMIGGVQPPISSLDLQRRKYLKIMHEYTGRNVICYYSAFLHKTGIQRTGIDDNDKNAFMQAVHKLDKTKGLDLVLHTPGGDIAATESIIDYLKQIFGNDIRAIIPQIAMSAGTMMAFSCKEIIMGKQSNLGPIDPQFNGVPCHGVLEEFEKALQALKADPDSVYLWREIIGKYHPTFLGECEKAIEWSEEMVRKWLEDNMFAEDENKRAKVQKILDSFSSHKNTKSHSKHIHIKECEELGIKLTQLENIMKGRQIDNCADFQDCVLTVHHCYMLTFSQSTALKIIENHLGNAMIING